MSFYRNQQMSIVLANKLMSNNYPYPLYSVKILKKKLINHILLTCHGLRLECGEKKKSTNVPPTACYQNQQKSIKHQQN